jgi:3-hydroxyisobutyrate dehydrogenase-like beta-hydroxyacid dehydrogenase
MKVGLIGLGAMGSAMAANLLKAGFDLTVWNRSADAVERLAEQGARKAATPAEAARGDVLVSMLADDAAVRDVVTARLLETAPKHLVHVNMATISAALAAELTSLHAAQGIGYVAAPVLGRPDVAAAAKLTIVAAGPAEAIDRVQPVLDAIGQKTWRLGDAPVNANVAKLAANTLLGAAVATMAETASLLDGYGVGFQDFLAIVTASTFPGPVYQGYGGAIAERRYTPALFKARLGLKDIRLALDAAAAQGGAMPVADVVRRRLEQAVADGDGEADLAVLGKGAARRAV